MHMLNELKGFVHWKSLPWRYKITKTGQKSWYPVFAHGNYYYFLIYSIQTLNQRVFIFQCYEEIIIYLCHWSGRNVIDKMHRRSEQILMMRCRKSARFFIFYKIITYQLLPLHCDTVFFVCATFMHKIVFNECIRQSVWVSGVSWVESKGKYSVKIHHV